MPSISNVSRRYLHPLLLHDFTRELHPQHTVAYPDNDSSFEDIDTTSHPLEHPRPILVFSVAFLI